jgi:hypothetical protein
MAQKKWLTSAKVLLAFAVPLLLPPTMHQAVRSGRDALQTTLALTRGAGIGEQTAGLQSQCEGRICI